MLDPRQYLKGATLLDCPINGVYVPLGIHNRSTSGWCLRLDNALFLPVIPVISAIFLWVLLVARSMEPPAVDS
jgi:hypothetical protein